MAAMEFGFFAIGYADACDRRQKEAAVAALVTIGLSANLKGESPATSVPTDLVTTSGSGPNPHPSSGTALFQVPRVAKARNMAENRVRQIVEEHTEGRTLGLLGEPCVNVLALNLASDRARGRCGVSAGR